MKIAISVGHTASGSYGGGAIGYLNESNETRIIAPLLQSYLRSVGHDVRILQVDKSNSYEYEDCYIRAREANSWGADLFIEIHLNSFSLDSANGTEVIIHPNDNTAISYAIKINNNICNILNTFDRTFGTGYKTSELIVLSNTNMPAILVEPLFCSNASDSSKYNADKIARAIANGIDSRININNLVENNKFEESDYPMYLFSENWYLERYKNDVAPAVKKGTFKNGYEHYVKYGKNEGRLPVPPVPSDFCEGDYLDLNQDVKKAVDKGSYVSGVHHFMLYGFKESHRKINKGETDEAAKKRVAELELKLEEIKKIVE